MNIISVLLNFFNLLERNLPKWFIYISSSTYDGASSFWISIFLSLFILNFYTFIVLYFWSIRVSYFPSSFNQSQFFPNIWTSMLINLYPYETLLMRLFFPVHTIPFKSFLKSIVVRFSNLYFLIRFYPFTNYFKLVSVSRRIYHDIYFL